MKINRFTSSITALFLAAPFLAFAQGCPYAGGYGAMGMGGVGNFFAPLGFLGMILGLIFWGAVIAGIIYLIKYFVRGNNNIDQAKNTPLSILKERYARGEIDKEEYQQKKKEIEEE